MQAYLVYGIIHRRFLPPREVVAVLTATTDIEATAFFKAEVAERHKVTIERIQVQRVLTMLRFSRKEIIYIYTRRSNLYLTIGV